MGWPHWTVQNCHQWNNWGHSLTNFSYILLTQKQCYSIYRYSNRNSTMILTSTKPPFFIQENTFCLQFQLHSRSSPVTFRTTSPIIWNTLISIQISNIRLPLDPTISRRRRIICLTLYLIQTQVVLIPRHPPLISVSHTRWTCTQICFPQLLSVSKPS